MDMRRSVLSAIIVVMVLVALINPVSAGDGSQNNSPDKQTYIVVFKDTNKDKKSVGETADVSYAPLPGKMKYKYKVINAQAVELTDDQLAKVKARSDVKYVVPDSQVYADLNDVVKLTNTTSAWSLGYTGRGVNVSVIDSGIDAMHRDLAGKVILWKDFVNNQPQAYDDWGHGTHVAGIIAGSGSASGGLYKGLANGANLFGAKVLDTSGVTNVSLAIAAIDWSVQNHADVISLSLSTSTHNQAFDDAIHNAVADGVVMVCSAGNTGPSQGSIRCPADSPDAITVGSVDMSNKTSQFSSRGPTWDGRTKPDIVAYGEGVISDRATGTTIRGGTPVGQYYIAMSGTSMSCPQVSAACAILLEKNRSLKPIDIKNVLLNSVKHIDTKYPNNNNGWGLLNVGAALNNVSSLVAPVASYTANVTMGDAPLTVQFTDTSSNSPTSWDWNFGDGTPNNNLQNPVYTYNTPGVYSVTLTASNSAGSNQKIMTGYINVSEKPAPVANFTANAITGDAPLTVQFTDTSSNSPTSWDWNFGDGTPDNNLQNPTHQYTSAGTYAVTLTVTNDGGSNTIVKANYITANNAPLTADFTANKTSGNAPLAIQFNDASTGNGITAWAWDFGDGATSALQNPVHLYTTVGNYSVTLTVTNANDTNSTTKTNYIHVLPIYPAADFSGTPLSGYDDAPLDVSFTDLSTGYPTGWSWYFGDGTTSALQNPAHQYTAAGTYTVNLTITNTNGSNTMSKKDYITVIPHWLNASFISDKSSGDYPLTVQFTDTSTGAPAPSSRDWDFGDGSAHASTQNPTHTYTVVGTYTVTLTVTNAGGTDSETEYVTVTKPTPTWKTYVSNYGGSTVSVINQTTDAVTSTITTGTGPFGIAFSPDGSLAYVAVESQNKVSVISTATDKIVNSITVGSSPRGVAMSPNGKRLYIGNYGSKTISVINTSDTSHYTTIGTIPGITNPFELWISPDGSRLYVSTYQANDVYVINTTSDNDTIMSTITGNRPYFISLDSAGTRLFVANYNSNNIQVYDALSLSLQATIDTAKGPLSPIISPDGSRLYYVTDGDNKLTIAYAGNYTVIKTVTCGSAVRGIACSPDGSKVYVTNMNSGTASIVNVTNDAGTVKSVRVGSSPYGLGQFAGYYPVHV